MLDELFSFDTTTRSKNFGKQGKLETGLWLEKIVLSPAVKMGTAQAIFICLKQCHA